MAGTPINEIFNEQAIASQISKVLAGLDAVSAAMKEVNGLTSATKTATNMAALASSMAALSTATETAGKATLSLKNEEEQLTITLTKSAAANVANAKSLTEVERLTRVYEEGMKRLNGTLTNEAELASQVKVANNEVGKQLKMQARDVLGLSGSYELLDREFKKISMDAKNLGITFGVNSQQFKEASAQALTLHNSLKAVDAGVGNFQRNVGNYAMGFQNFNYVLREMPNFAISAQIGIQSLSNNIPMLVDEIKAATAKGMDFGGVMKTLGASLFSIGGVAVILTTALTALPKILSALETEADKAAAKMHTFREVQDEAIKSTYKEKVELEALLIVARSDTKSKEEKSAAVKKINDITPAYLGAIKLESINTSETNDKIRSYIQMLSKKALAQAYIKKLQDEHTKMVDLEAKSLGSFVDNGTKVMLFLETFSQIASGKNPFKEFNRMLTAEGAVSKQLARNFQGAKIGSLEGQFAEDLRTSKAIMDLDKEVKEAKVKKVKETVDLVAKYAEEERKILFEIEQSKLKALQDTYLTVSKNTELSYETRVAAAKNAYFLEAEILQNKNQFELSETYALEVAMRKAKGTPEEKKAEQDRFNADKKQSDNAYNLESVQAENNYLETLRVLAIANAETIKKETEKRVKDTEDSRLKGITDSEDNIKNTVIDGQMGLNAALVKVNSRFLAGEIKTREDFEKAKLIITAEYTIQSIEMQIAATKQLMASAKLTKTEEIKFALQLSELEKKLSEAKISLDEKAHKMAKKNFAERMADLKKTLDAINQIASNVTKAISEVASIGFEKRSAALEEEKTAIEKNGKAELDRINASSLSLQDKANATILLEAKKQTQIEENDRKRRQLEVDRAKFERLNSIANIITGTATAVVGALAQVVTMGPLAIVLAATIGALGAAQLAKAIATPVPKYAKGTENHPGGLAIVGDGGRSERLILPTGEHFDTPNKATLMDLPRGTKVLPSADEVNKIMAGAMLRRTSVELQKDRTAEAVDNQTAILKRAMERNKPKVHNKINVNLGRELWLYKNIYE